MPTRTLTLMRHGKSSWRDETLTDRKRPLNERGKKNVPAMAARLQTLGIRPSLIVASPAKRAWSTAKLVADAIGYPREFMQREDQLYLADAGKIRTILGQIDAGFHNVLVCCHNPGITDFANDLVPGVTSNIPTSGCVIVNANCEDWALFADADVELVGFEYPKKDLT